MASVERYRQTLSPDQMSNLLMELNTRQPVPMELVKEALVGELVLTDGSVVAWHDGLLSWVQTEFSDEIRAARSRG